MSKKRTAWMAALISLLVYLIWVSYTNWNQMFAQSASARFALLCLFEATHQYELHNEAMVVPLLHAAGQSLGVASGQGLLSHLSELEQKAILRTQLVNSPTAIILRQLSWIGAILSIVVVYFWREKTLNSLRNERELLRDKLLAISSGWMLATVKPGSVKEVIAHIIDQVTQYTEISSVEILSQEMRSDSPSLHFYSRSGPPISDSLRHVPSGLLRVDAGAIGDSMHTRRAWYSGVHGEAGTILPGVRIANTAVYPLVDRNTVRGVMVLRGSGRQWNTQLADLVAIIAREIAILLTYGKMEEEAVKVARYREMDRLRTDLLANVSHELRTPLGIMQGYAETLVYRGEQLSAGQRSEFAQLIVEESEQLENQIDKLLKVATWESAGIHMKSGSFLVFEWIDRVQRRVAINERVLLHLTGDQNVCLHGDQEEILDATFNLIDNASKYSAGSIDLYITVLDHSLRVAVADHGIGVGALEMERIFERFYRGGTHARSEIRGSGLGLSIVKDIVEAHNGEVWARKLADGFEVGFELPVD